MNNRDEEPDQDHRPGWLKAATSPHYPVLTSHLRQRSRVSTLGVGSALSHPVRHSRLLSPLSTPLNAYAFQRNDERPSEAGAVRLASSFSPRATVRSQPTKIDHKGSHRRRHRAVAPVATATAKKSVEHQRGYNLAMAKKVLKFPEQNIARLRLLAHFAEDRNECISENTIEQIAKKPRRNPTAKKQNQK